MPIVSDKVRGMKDKEDAGLKCIVKERGREINEFDEFVLVGFDDEEALLTFVADVDEITTALLHMMKAYKHRWEELYKEHYKVDKEFPIEDIIEDFVKSANEIDFDRPEEEDSEDEE